MHFKLANNNEEAVLVEVVFEDLIDSMSYKAFTGKERYIKCTKGSSNILTVYNENADILKVFYFGQDSFGQSRVLTNEIDVNLKLKLIHFLLSNHIQISRYNLTETELSFTEPHVGYSKTNYTVKLGGEFAAYLKSEDEIKKLFGNYEVYDVQEETNGAKTYYAKLQPLEVLSK